VLNKFGFMGRSATVPHRRRTYFFYTSSPHTRYPGKHTILLQCNIHIYIRAVERVSCEEDIIAGRPLSAAASIAPELGW